jgi:ribosomal protein S18 acetylase RimI-like enzyme
MALLQPALVTGAEVTETLMFACYRLAWILHALGRRSLAEVGLLSYHLLVRHWQQRAVLQARVQMLLAAWMDGTIAGTVQLDLAMSENQPHRAELEKLLVHPEFRRRGIARALLRRAEQAAIGHGRTLLTLDTRAGDLAEALYRAMGWTEAGRIPAYALNADRTPSDTVFFWRRLAP